MSGAAQTWTKLEALRAGPCPDHDRNQEPSGSCTAQLVPATKTFQSKWTKRNNYPHFTGVQVEAE